MISVGTSIKNQAILLLKENPHFLFIILPYPAGTKNSITKQIKPTPNKTNCAILKANISFSIYIEYRVSMYQSQEIKIGGMLEELCKLEEGIKMAEATLFRENYYIGLDNKIYVALLFNMEVYYSK